MRDGSAEAAKRFFTEHLPRFFDRPVVPNLQKLDAVFSIELTDPALDAFTILVEGARIRRVYCERIPKEHCRFRLPVEVFLEIVAARLDPREAFFAGKTEIAGDFEVGLSLVAVMAEFFRRNPYQALIGADR